MRANVNGIQIAYTDEGHGVPLVFLHGFPLSRAAWSKQLEAFKGDHRVITPDLRGFGDSDASEGPVSMGQYAEDIFALIQQLKCGPVYLIGHSMGGYVALAFAHAFPRALRGLVPVGTKAGEDFEEDADDRRALADRVKKEGITPVVDALASRMVSARSTDPELAQAVHGFLTSAKPAGVRSALLGMAARPDQEKWIQGLRLPTLVVTGLDDIIIPPHESEAIASAIGGAQLKLIPNAGHLVPYEQPAAFNLALRAWLTSQPEAR